MNSFEKRVIAGLKNQNWQIGHVIDPCISFIAYRERKHGRKAYRVKAHGHLKKREIRELHDYGRVHDVHVIFVHETENHEMVFVRIWPQNIEQEK